MAPCRTLSPWIHLHPPPSIPAGHSAPQIQFRGDGPGHVPQWSPFQCTLPCSHKAVLPRMRCVHPLEGADLTRQVDLFLILFEQTRN